jgi:hypothetical protein
VEKAGDGVHPEVGSGLCSFLVFVFLLPSPFSTLLIAGFLLGPLLKNF